MLNVVRLRLLGALKCGAYHGGTIGYFGGVIAGCFSLVFLAGLIHPLLYPVGYWLGWKAFEGWQEWAE